MIFTDRYDAGRQLAERLLIIDITPSCWLSPGAECPWDMRSASRLDVPLDLIIPRKLPIPSEPEAGFGAVAPDGTIVLNEEMVAYLGLTPREIGEVADVVLSEVKRRAMEYRGDRPLPEH